MQEKKRRGLDDLIPLNENNERNNDLYNVKKRYTRTIAIKVTAEEYETYRLVSKYYGPDEIIKKWRSDLDELIKERGEKLKSLDRDVNKTLERP